MEATKTFKSEEKKTDTVEKPEPNRLLKRNIGEVAVDSKTNGKIQHFYKEKYACGKFSSNFI